MADASWAPGSGRNDGWGPSTSVRGATTPPAAEPARATEHVSTRAPRPAKSGRAADRVAELGKASRRGGRPAPTPAGTDADGWQSGPPRGAERPDRRAAARPIDERIQAARPQAPQRGLRVWAALLLLVAVMVLGLVVDGVRGQSLGTGFDLGIILGSVVAVLTVRRSGMFWIVVSPPIAYSLGAGISLYTRSSGLSDRSVLIDAAANWLIYGFPAIAAASAAVLIIAGIRLIARR